MSKTLIQISNLSGDSFTFSTATAAFEEFQRESRANWSGVARLGETPQQHFTGREEAIKMRGTVYTAIGPGVNQIATLRGMLQRGERVSMVALTPTNNNLGLWVIDSINETQSAFVGAGQPRKQTFDIAFKFYG